MEENLLLAIFAILPVVLALLFYLYFKNDLYSLNSVRGFKLIAGNIIVFLFLLSLVVLFGEIYYRFFYDTTDSWELTKVSRKWYKKHYVLNNYGVRDSIDYNPEFQGKYRVTFIGDSFTAGHGINNVEDRFVNRIRRMRPDIEIHAFAMNGWDTYFYMLNLEKLISSGYRFNTVVLVYNLNDIADIMDKWKSILERIYSLKAGFLFENSYFFNILYYRYYISHNREISDYFDFVTEAYEGPLWEKQKERLIMLKAMLDSRGINLMVVTFPFFNGLGQDYKYRKIHNQLDVFWKSIGVLHLDLLQIYEKYNTKDLIVNSHDVHPNVKAHSIAAEAIGQFLEKYIPKGGGI